MHVIIVKMPVQNNAVLIGRLNDEQEATTCIIDVEKKNSSILDESRSLD